MFPSRLEHSIRERQLALQHAAYAVAETAACCVDSQSKMPEEATKRNIAPSDQHRNRKANLMNLRRRASRPYLSRRIASIAAVALFKLLIGCTVSASGQPARVAEKQRAYIAGSCAALKEQASGAVPVGILLEVADVVEPIGVPIKDWLSGHSVQVHHVAKISVPMTANTPVHGPFGTCLDHTCSEAEDATLEVIVTRAPTDASTPVELQLNLTSGNRQPRRLSVKTTDQEPVVASMTTPPEQTVVITPYYLFESKQRGLALLIQCASQTPRATGSN